MEEHYTILKSTDKDIIAKDGNDSIITVSHSRLEERIDHISSPKVNKYTSIIGSTLIITSNDSEIRLLKEKYYHIHAQFKDEQPWIEISGTGTKLNNIECYAIGLKTSRDHEPITGYISNNFSIGKKSQELQFHEAYILGTKVIKYILKNKTIKDEAREFMAWVALQNSHFNITNKRLLRTIGRIFI